MVLFGDTMNRVAKASFEFRLQLDIGILRSACADCEKETSPLNAQWSILGSRSPPSLILLYKRRRIDNVVVIINIVKEVLDKYV